MADSLHTTVMHQLLDQIQQGDRQAANELIDRSGKQLHTLAQRQLRGFPIVRRWQESEDVVQVAVMRLLNALKTRRPESTNEFFRFASTLIRRELLNLARHYRGATNHAAHHDSQGDAAPLLLQQTPDPLDIKNLERWTAFHETIDTLSDELREVLELRFYKGLTHDEIARIVQINEKTVRLRLARAAEIITERLGDEVPDW